MLNVWEVPDVLMPVCGTFGVLFLVINGKTERYTRLLRYVGAVMVSAALLTTWLSGTRQKARLDLLEQRIGYVETNRR